MLVSRRCLVELEVGSLTGAAYGEKRPERLAQRNGYRDWETRAGTVELRIEAAQGPLFPRLPGTAPDGREGAHRVDLVDLSKSCR
jgi:transposase-like protein